jgi:hypothetical protein
LTFDPERDGKAKAKGVGVRRDQTSTNNQHGAARKHDVMRDGHLLAQTATRTAENIVSDETLTKDFPTDDLLARQLKQLNVTGKPIRVVGDQLQGHPSTLRFLSRYSRRRRWVGLHLNTILLTCHQNDQVSGRDVRPCGSSSRDNVLDKLSTTDMTSLLPDDSDDDDHDFINGVGSELQQAPLFSASVAFDNNLEIAPQYGLLGSHDKEALFLSTNVPFSAFICGVQGSGKSHTTACMLEDALIPLRQLGRLESPLSALVFNYGQFGGDGSGFSISEAAFLGAPNPELTEHAHVKKVNVLVSPSNYVKIAKLYTRVPNVTVSNFKLKPHNLDIEIMLTLMNVHESDETPLYMAAVTQILREMATEGDAFNYFTFKDRLNECHFNLVQTNMLQMRLGLLESFLDLDNSCPEPQFKEGEVTILDMSCPFVDANTACILFKIGLQRYLQSKATGKMVVLDEAHKVRRGGPQTWRRSRS